MKRALLPTISREQLDAEMAKGIHSGMNACMFRGESRTKDAELQRLQNAVAELASYFTSGNGVPVERATILAKDFWRITGLTPSAGGKRSDD